MTESDVQALVTACAPFAASTIGELDAPDGYQSVPLCVIEAIYSIGVRYEGVENVVRRYKRHWADFGVDADEPSHTTGDLLSALAERDDLADSLFDNRQLTSTRGGILKAEAVVQMHRVLDEFGIQTTEQLRSRFDDAQLDAGSRSVHGQRSGISTKYLFLLAGVEDAVKPDRMITRFVSLAVGRRVSPLEAQELVQAASVELRGTNSALTPRVLDHQIWAATQEVTARVLSPERSTLVFHRSYGNA